MKEIKVCVGFDNFEMGFEKQEISRLNPRVSHQQLSPLLAIFYLLCGHFWECENVTYGTFVMYGNMRHS